MFYADKKTDIVFIVPAAEPLLQEESIGSLILAKKLKLYGYSVKILRFWEIEGFNHNYRLFRNNVTKEALSYNPMVISFYCRCTDYHICIDLSEHLKIANPKVIIAFGGPQAELVARDTLINFSFIDYICCSEGENTIIPFIKYVKNDKSDVYVPGLVFRDNNGIIIQNKLPELLEDNYKRGFDYYDLIPNEVIENSHRTSIDVGRGCPFSCTFCSTKTFWKQRFRLRDIKDLVDEIESVVTNYNILTFDLDHDLFTVNKKRVLEFCSELKRRNLNIHWFCSSRIDTIDYEMIDLMVDCGMNKILFGIETGSSRMQSIINKNLNLQRCIETTNYCIRKGIKVLASFIYGLPEDTEDDFERTFQLMQEMEHNGARIMVWLCGILNGTALYNRYKDDLYFSENNVKNSSFFGFDETKTTIMQNLNIFPHFCEYHNELRDELHYFELFRNVWNSIAPQSFHVLSQMIINRGSRLLDVYRLFCLINLKTLNKAGYQCNDQFWGLTRAECRSMIWCFLKTIQVGKNDLSLRTEEVKYVMEYANKEIETER